MARAQLIIASVVVEGRSKSEVAREYGVSRYWVQQLVHRFEREGPAAYSPRSRRPHSNPQAVDADLEELIVRLRKERGCQVCCVNSAVDLGVGLVGLLVVESVGHDGDEFSDVGIDPVLVGFLQL